MGQHRRPPALDVEARPGVDVGLYRGLARGLYTNPSKGEKVAQFCGPRWGNSQVLLGHTKLDTTARYTQVATTTIRNVTSPLDHLIGKIKKDEPPA